MGCAQSDDADTASSHPDGSPASTQDKSSNNTPHADTAMANSNRSSVTNSSASPQQPAKRISIKHLQRQRFVGVSPGTSTSTRPEECPPTDPLHRSMSLSSQLAKKRSLASLAGSVSTRSNAATQPNRGLLPEQFLLNDALGGTAVVARSPPKSNSAATSTADEAEARGNQGGNPLDIGGGFDFDFNPGEDPLAAVANFVPSPSDDPLLLAKGNQDDDDDEAVATPEEQRSGGGARLFAAGPTPPPINSTATSRIAETSGLNSSSGEGRTPPPRPFVLQSDSNEGEAPRPSPRFEGLYE